MTWQKRGSESKLAYWNTMLPARDPLYGWGCGATTIGQVKVCQHDVTRMVKKDVLWLQISIDES